MLQRCANPIGQREKSVSDEALERMVHYAAQREGMFVAREAAATIVAYHELLTSNFLKPEDEVVLFFTGSGLTDLAS